MMITIDDIVGYIDNNNGIFTFAYQYSDEYQLEYFLEIVKGKTSKKKVFENETFINSFDKVNSILILNIDDVLSGGDTQHRIGDIKQNSIIMREIASNSYKNNNSIILLVPVYKSFIGDMSSPMSSPISYSSSFISIFSNNKLLIRKSKWDGMENEINILDIRRDYKLNIIGI